MRATSRGEAGFTLIEAMLAMVLLSVGLLAVAGMQTSSVSGNAKARFLSEAVVLLSARAEVLQNAAYTAASVQDGNGTNAGTAGYNDGVTAGTTADGSAASGNYSIYWNVANNTPAGNCKTIRILVTHNRLQSPVTVDIIKVQDI